MRLRAATARMIRRFVIKSFLFRSMCRAMKRIRSVATAICTSGEPVSPGKRAQRARQTTVPNDGFGSVMKEGHALETNRRETTAASLTTAAIANHGTTITTGPLRRGEPSRTQNDHLGGSA